jgi:hypothetical protein
MILSCSSVAHNDFEKVVARLDKYFSENPVVLTSTRIISDHQEVHVYYSLKITKYKLSYKVRKSYSITSPYNAIVNISCSALNNAKSGDTVADIVKLTSRDGSVSLDASGFSTTSLALTNRNFSSGMRPFTFTIRYAYQNNHWICTGISGSSASESFIPDLESFPQNKNIREAIGMNI